MRIGIEAQRIFRRKKHGMDIYALELIKALQEIDRQNEYYIFVKKGPDICLAETGNFKIILVPGFTYVDWEQIQLPIAAAKFQLDFLHCTSNTAPILTKIPTLITLHDIIYLQQGFQGGSPYQKLGHIYRKWVVPKVFAKAKIILTVSEYEAKFIRKHFKSQKRIVSIYNGINAKFRPITCSNSLSSIDLPDDYILFLGNTAPKKNLSRVLAAYSKYQELSKSPLPLVILDMDRAYILHLLIKMGLPLTIMNQIYLPGYVPHDLLPLLYSNASLFLYPSLRESFGIPIIESMACGTPVITASNSSMPEIGKWAAEYVDPYNIDHMAKSILTISTNNKLRHRMINLGKIRAQQFNWSITSQNTLNCYYETFSRIYSPKIEVRAPTIESVHC
ncbi:MAG: glycosyltransferase family 4 protein [Cyclobacteriaceae bacterium]